MRKCVLNNYAYTQSETLVLTVYSVSAGSGYSGSDKGSIHTLFAIAQGYIFVTLHDQLILTYNRFTR